MLRSVHKRVHKHIRSASKVRLGIYAGALLIVGFIVYQFTYSTDKLLPNASIDSVQVGGLTKKDAAKRLDDRYASTKVPIYFSDSDKVKVSPALPELGVVIKSTDRVAKVDYPWFMRLIPSSVFWYNAPVDEPKAERNQAKLDEYMKAKFGEGCVLAPINATITHEGSVLKVVEDTPGGECDAPALRAKLTAVKPSLKQDKVVVTGTTIPAKVSTEQANAEKTRLTTVLEKGVSLKVLDETEVISKDVVLPLVEYTINDNGLLVGLNGEKTTTWLSEKYGKKLAIAPGVTKISTYDFTITSRVDGPSGRALDTEATRVSITSQLSGKEGVSNVTPKAVAPTIQYTRSYSPTDTGISALMKNYAESHPGTYGVSLIEMSGSKRRANYNGAQQFTTASTYKLFVAYSTLLRIERGEWQWTDQVSGGRNLSKCFDDMIKLSDNACAEVLLKRAGLREVTNEMKALGMSQTTFMGSDSIKSSPNDEALFLGALYSGQMLSQQSSRDRLINAMKANVYRKGIPAGIPGAVVADKVGFLDALLHDAAIVYAPTGNFVLVIMTEGSTWGNIAELAGQIEALRTK